MSVMNINDLPVELIFTIFELALLNGRKKYQTIDTIRSTCKTWKRLMPKPSFCILRYVFHPRFSHLHNMKRSVVKGSVANSVKCKPFEYFGLKLCRKTKACKVNSRYN